MRARTDTPPPCGGRTIVVADTHGCLDEVLDLLDKVALTASDRVIFVGDFVDRGPKPRECVEVAMGHLAVVGNHEEKALRERHMPRESLHPTHVVTQDALGSEHYAWFESLPTAIRLPEHGAVVVHAGMYPGVPVEEQDPRHLLHIQCINPPSPKSFWPSRAPAGFTFWTNHWTGERVIFGHSVLTKPLVLPHAVGIDTGVCFGGGLTAVVLPSWEVVTVPSRTPAVTGRRGSVARFEIHEGVFAYS